MQITTGTDTSIESLQFVQAVRWLRQQSEVSDFWLEQACTRYGLTADEETLNDLAANYFHCPEIDGDASF